MVPTHYDSDIEETTTLHDKGLVVAKIEQFNNLVSTLTEEYKALGNTDLFFTAFIPTNNAFSEIPLQLLSTITSNTRTAQKLRKRTVRYHLIRFDPDLGEYALRAFDLGNRAIGSDAVDGPRLFFRRLTVQGNEVEFVNGAGFLESIEASNGIVHIIDKFLLEVADTGSALDFIKQQSTDRFIELRTSKFLDILETSKILFDTPYPDLEASDTFVTVFVPTDRALTDLTTDRIGKLKSNKPQLIKLLRRHIISSSSGLENAGVEAVYHAHLLEVRRQEALRKSGGLAEIPAMEGSIKPISVNKELYVTNTCGRVKILMTAHFDRYSSRRPEETPVFANNTVNNGVVHLVDGLLGYIYNDALDMIREDRQASSMARHISRVSPTWAERLHLPEGKRLRAHERVTVFVPINEAFHRVERSESMRQFTNNITFLQEVLNQHVVRGQHSLTDITMSSVLPTLSPDRTATFRWEGDDLFVKVDHVEGRVVVPDVCVENGILHFVDAVLGVPYLTIYDYIDKDPSLLNLYKYVRKSGIEIVLNNVGKPVTFFAPNHQAFEEMKLTIVGRELLANDGASENKLQQVLIAHTVRGYFYTDEMNSNIHHFPGSQLTLIKEGDDYFVERRGDYMTVRARVLQKDLRMTNGVLYIIDAVLYQDSQTAFNAIPVSAARGRHLTRGHVTFGSIFTGLLIIARLCWR